MADLPMPPAPTILAAAEAVGRHRRPATPARRQVLREFRDQVASGTYQPPVDAVSEALAAWLLCDGLADLERR
ncbi:MAG TPA: hypothetical protein VF152_16315 [Acidimicrobiia bacterium]